MELLIFLGEGAHASCPARTNPKSQETPPNRSSISAAGSRKIVQRGHRRCQARSGRYGRRTSPKIAEAPKCAEPDYTTVLMTELESLRISQSACEAQDRIEHPPGSRSSAMLAA